MSYIDAHAHVFDKQRSALTISELINEFVGTDAVSLCGTHPADWLLVQSVSQRLPHVYPSYGLHPWFLDKKENDWQQLLERFLHEPNAGVGEIGLDFSLPKESWSEQISVFEFQFDLAVHLNKRLSIHAFKAWNYLEPFLIKHAQKRIPTLLHSFNGNTDLLKRLEKFPNLFFGFSGSILSTTHNRALQCLSQVNKTRILLESDGLSSQLLLAHIHQKASRHRGIDEKKLHELMHENFILHFLRS